MGVFRLSLAAEHLAAGPTPVSDLIRRAWRSRLRRRAVLADPHDLPPGHPASPVSKQDETNVPAFKETDLDNPHLLSSAAAEIYRMRRARDQHLSDDLMGGPAWDMLLALYAEEPAKLPVSSICYASGLPTSTALRWLTVLESRGLVEKTELPRDKRISQVGLTGEGRCVMEDSLKAILRASRA